MTKPLILWVEDNPNDVLLVQRAFVEVGIDAEFIVPDNAVAAFHYMEAREQYRLSRRPPDLILLDLNLPAMPGTRVLEEAKRYKPWAHIPIVVLTSSADPKELATCERKGARECITKPQTFEGYLAIVERLRKYLPRSGGHPTSTPPPIAPVSDPPSSSFFRTSGRDTSVWI